MTPLPLDAFKDMFSPAVRSASSAHMMALLNRSTVVIAGDLAVCVRVASKQHHQIIHSATMQDHWLKPTKKEFYGLHKEAQHDKPPGFRHGPEAEASLMGELLATATEKEYIQRGGIHEK